MIDILKQIEDPRQAQGKRYSLWFILIIAIVAVMCGSKSYSEISEWGKNHKEIIKSSLDIKTRKIPCASTFYNILSKIDVKVFENIIYEYIGKKVDKNDAIAYDGKTMRGTRKRGGEFSHLLSAFSHKLAGTLFQISVESKTNEISAIQEIFKKMNLENKIATMDALLTQTEIAKTIIHYIGEVGFMGYIKNCAIKDVSPLVDALLQGGKDIQMGPLLCQYILVCRASEGLCT